MRKFTIIITLLVYLSGCSKSIILTSEEIKNSGQEKITGLQLYNNKRVNIDDDSKILLKPNKKLSVINSDSKIHYPINSIRYFILNRPDSSEKLKYTTPDKYQLAGDLAKKIIEFPVKYTTNLENQKTYYNSAFVNQADKTIEGELRSGESSKISLDSVKYVKFQKFDIGNTIGRTVGITGLVFILFLFAFAMDDFDFYGD